MTNFIVAEFACSVWKSSETDRMPTNKRVGDFKVYPTVSGSVFSEEYNETLDSATLVLSQVSKEDRLVDIAPFQYVHVYDASGNTNFDRLYLVDNFVEKENNIKEHLFSYTINLMSETKWLEKIQCPNLSITHKVENGVISKKTIYQHIKQYLELYSPKIKICEDGEIWSYQPLIKFPSTSSYEENINFDETNFTQQGDEYEVIAYSDVLPISYDINTVEIKSFQVSTTPSIVFAIKSVTIDIPNRRLKFDGTTQNLPTQINGIVNIVFSCEDSNDVFHQKFDVPCADMSFTAPTLRQLLTTLMIQVGCIPIVKNRTLGFLDFQKDLVPFGQDDDYTIGNTVNYIQRGLSSDSYANTLVNISDNVLDSENEVVCEALGFRDLEHVLLKQEENLFLETKFPIYKVNYFEVNSYVDTQIDIKNIQDTMNSSVSINQSYWKWGITITKSGGTITIGFGLSFIQDSGILYDIGIRVKGQLVCFKYNYEEMQVIDIDEFFYSDNFTPGGGEDEFLFNLDDANYDKFYFSGTMGCFDPTEYYSGAVYDVFCCNFTGADIHSLTLYSQNITPLLVEQSVRQNLSNNFNDMIAETTGYQDATATIETLAKYVYGTVGYNIGSKKISGFSEIYNVGSSTAFGWITTNYTYIENIWNFIIKHYTNSISNTVRKMYGNFPVVEDNIYAFDYDTYDAGNMTYQGSNASFELDSVYPYNPYFLPILAAYPKVLSIFRTNFNFAYLWFDIKYQPLNTFNLSYVKLVEEIDIPIEQFDSNASGLTDFDRLSVHEQEQVDRIGNETLTISQRTNNINDVQTFENGPLVFLDDTNRSGGVDDEDKGIKYTIFKYSFTINNNCFNVSYTGSKDAILKNYFTSIRTKYRAYQYVDYSSSVLRKEKDVIYARISENNWYNGDDKVFFGNFSSNSQDNQQNLSLKLLGSWKAKTSSGSAYDVSSQVSVKNNVLSSDNTQTKNDASVITTSNFFAVIYEECDNVGSGTFLTNDSMRDVGIQQMAHTNGSYLIGGVPQTWQIWENDYNVSHIVSYASYLDIAGTFDTYINVDLDNPDVGVQEDMAKIMNLPVLSTDYLDLYNSKNVVFSIVADNTQAGINANARKRLFYKDYAERINHTVQFIYYTDSENIIWTENFFRLNDVGGNFNFNNINLISLEGKNFKLEKEPYLSAESPILVSGNIVTFHNGTEETPNVNPYILIDWSLIPNITQFKVAGIYGAYHYDALAFKKGSNNIQKFYLTLNDTKTDYVLAENNGILYRRYKVNAYSPTNLPKTYRTLEYIQNNGTQFLNLGFVPNTNEEWSFELSYTDVAANGSNYVMGSRVSSQTIYFGVTGATATKAITIANTDLTKANNYRVANRKYLVTANYYGSNEGSCVLKNVTVDEEFHGQQNVSLSGAVANVCLFALNNGNIHQGMKVQYLKVWKGSTLFRDLVPAKRISDDVLGMYDKVNNVLYTNAGTGTFIAGPVIDEVLGDRTVINNPEIFDEEE